MRFVTIIRCRERSRLAFDHSTYRDLRRPFKYHPAAAPAKHDLDEAENAARNNRIFRSTDPKLQHYNVALFEG
jgi:hypothetical protein